MPSILPHNQNKIQVIKYKNIIQIFAQNVVQVLFQERDEASLWL